ncbi:NAD(P)H-hydrate dehydratase [Paracoccus suum]|uniref:ADP-dependent (S)-NAD(P)H-hydrate dehydratase n=1 Tax=Paracoccus suum TaxID=2259340 RepID=A0A344PI95_9RHOB|nr:NAD(P)H-hydrate dehydratase [Paracoccus suum]AXC49100.1 NAD(P)H-hydrate dehydratase [Paracoccus suum]
MSAKIIGPPTVAKLGGHKYDHGHVLVLGGPAGHGGAARLAARAALRVGAGLVTLGVPPDAMGEYTNCPDALMRRAVGDADALRELLADSRINTVALGPGLGRERAAPLSRAAAASGRRLVIDADALEPKLPRLPPHSVLTPHEGEFARLARDLPLDDRTAAAQAAAERFGAVLLLKGPRTVVAAPDGRAAIHDATGPRAVPWLATAGAGDVLTGLIAGLLARGIDAFEAACAAAWLHCAAARRFGPGLIADDLPEMLPAVLREIGA